MTVKELIDVLRIQLEHGLDPKAVVKAHCPDQEKMAPVTGLLIDSDSVEFCTMD